MFGIGVPEIIFVALLALIIFGPEEMKKAGNTLGRLMRRLARSDTWTVMKEADQEIRYLPNKLMREANEAFEQLDGESPGDPLAGAAPRDAWAGRPGLHAQAVPRPPVERPVGSRPLSEPGKKSQPARPQPDTDGQDA